MPLDDLFDHLEDIFDDVEDLFEDFVEALLGKKKKKRKKLSKSAKKHGGTVAIASMATAAYKQWEKKGKSGESEKVKAEPVADPKPEPEKEFEVVTVTECLKVNMVLAMICAAGADGKIDRKEMAVLQGAIDDSDISDPDKQMLTRMLNSPPTLEGIASGATSPLEACELYGAALSVIVEDSPAETLFLRRFAKALELDDDLVETIHRTISGE